MSKSIYLDNSTTTRPSNFAVSTMLPFLMEHWGTPSAPHQKGQELYPAISESLKKIYRLLGAKEDDLFIFTSNGAEAVNQVIHSAYIDITTTTGKNHFITSSIDEAPALVAASRLEIFGCVNSLLNASKEGFVAYQTVSDTISPRTALISLSWANGMTGVIQPIFEIVQLCKQRGIALHLDATHVLGKLYYDFAESGPDFITFNGDNLHAPKGTGGLWIPSGRKCSSFITGGTEQVGHRAGNYSVAALAALGSASQEAFEQREYVCTEVARLRNHLEEEILKRVSDAVVFFQHQERVPHISALGFPGVVNEALLYDLNRKGLYASIGGGSFQQIGYILKASGIPDLLANSAVSFSLSRETSDDEIDHAIEIIVESVQRLRKLSKGLEVSP